MVTCIVAPALAIVVPEKVDRSIVVAVVVPALEIVAPNTVDALAVAAVCET
jgi:hypothetical protein